MDAWNTRGEWYASSSVHQLGPSLPKLLALARPGPNDHCLDIGTGTGHTAAALAEYAAHVVGLDLSEGMLRTAHELYGERKTLTFYHAPADNSGLEARSFDLITARHTLHHHPDVTATLAEAARLLKPGGRLVIVDETTPNAEVDAWFDALERAHDPTHMRAYSLNEWQSFIARVGLTWIVGDAHTVYTLDIDNWLEGMNLSSDELEAAYALFRQADAHARQTFNIAYDGDEATRFDLPMALILAVKPG